MGRDLVEFFDNVADAVAWHKRFCAYITVENLQRKDKMKTRLSVDAARTAPLLRRLVAQAVASGIERSNMWVIIGNRMEERNGKQCRERWVNHLDPTIKKGAWSKEEETLLDTLHKECDSQLALLALLFWHRR